MASNFVKVVARLDEFRGMVGKYKVRERGSLGLGLQLGVRTLG